MKNIPQADLNEFLSKDPKRKAAFVKHIGASFQEIGFLALKGHFLEEDLKVDLYREINAFFALPTSNKEAYEIEGGGGQRGYTGFGKEHAAGRTTGDLKEFWHFGQYVEGDVERAKEYPENVLVEELPKFNEVGKQTYKMLEKTAKYVLRSLALHLDLEETYFDHYIRNGNSILRPIHYPPIKTEPKGTERAAAHGDINLSLIHT